MRAGAVMRVVVPHLRETTSLMQLLGNEPRAIVRRAAKRPKRVPAIAYTIVSDVPRESTARVLVQFDLWARGAEAMDALKLALYGLLHTELPREIRGLRMWTLYQDGREHEDPEEGVCHSSVDFLFEPAKAEE